MLLSHRILPPWETDKGCYDEDSIAQLLRRFIVIRFDSGTAQGWSGNTEPTTDPDTDSDASILNAMNTQDTPTSVASLVSLSAIAQSRALTRENT